MDTNLQTHRQTDRQSPRKFYLRFPTYEADTSVPSGIQTFSETDVSASRLAKPKYSFWTKFGPAVKLIDYRKEPKYFSRNFILYFPIARLTHLCHVASRLSLNRCASLEIGTAKNPISGNMSVCSCFCRKII